MKKACYILALLLLLLGVSACQPYASKTEGRVDSLCLQAYRMRYSDIDSTEAILERALTSARPKRFAENRARAMVLMGFVRYQQMDFEGSLSLSDSVYDLSNNQITMLCADVLKMKVMQRVCDVSGYYKVNSQAMRRMSLIHGEKDELNDIDLHMFQYAESEYHFIASTYYYYQQQDSMARNEMLFVQSELEQMKDTTQLVYYHYMMGSGGLVSGDGDDILVKEFDHLLMSYTLSRRAGILYFEANSLQGFANMLKTPYERSLIRQRFPMAYQILVSQHLSWREDEVEHKNENEDENKNEGEDEWWLPTALARHALHTFREYDDLFQMACCYRTIGELESMHGHYDASLDAFNSALMCVNRHHILYYDSKDDTLTLYPDSCYLASDFDSVMSNERRWIEDKNVLTVPEWMAGIREQISLVFSCMNDRIGSNYNRSIYLDILECTSQNLEMESRISELKTQFSVQHRLMWAAMALLVIVLLMCGYIFFRQEMHDIAHLNILGRNKGRLLRKDKHRLDEMNDELEELQEQCEVTRVHISRNKSQSMEKRAKVSLVQAVTPFIDRIVNEVNRMNRDSNPQPEQLNYIAELTDGIMNYNDILTEWIKIEQGQLSLHISTLSVESIFDILRKGHFAYDQKGIEIRVHPTEAKVKADEALTLFMLNTLADNARKFTPTGGTITVEAKETEEYVELSVSDTGCGMSQDDIDIILQNKVYDATKIGINSESENLSEEEKQQRVAKKGHGFGLMNCKGIIEKYRKTAAIFSVCSFGIESKIGQGSRFFFRLPRVLMLVMMAVYSCLTYAQTDEETLSRDYVQTNNEYDYYYNCLYANNVGDADAALSYADSALMYINDSFVLCDDRVASASQTADIQSFMQGDSIDYALLMNIRNQIAVAALVIGDRKLYSYNNNICTQLYRLLNQDANLPTYYDRIKRADVNIRQITVVLVVLSLIVVVLVVMLIRNRKHLADRLTMNIQSKIEQQRDELNHLHFEENRFYVQNQILDNCLSTIKHESMYFPSRIGVLVERMLSPEATNESKQSDLQQLTELSAYYKRLYALLSSHADRQLQQNVLRIQKVTLDDLVSIVRRTFREVSRKERCETQLEVKCNVEGEMSVRAESMALEELFHQLFAYTISAYPMVAVSRVEIDQDGAFIRISLNVDGLNLTDQQAHELFTPSRSRIPLLVVKQIIREFDALNNNPGLRLIAEHDHIWFTLVINN